MLSHVVKGMISENEGISPYLVYDFKCLVLYWNVRGYGGKKFRTAISDLVPLYEFDVLIVSEPRVPFSRAKIFFKNMSSLMLQVSNARGLLIGSESSDTRNPHFNGSMFHLLHHQISQPLKIP